MPAARRPCRTVSSAHPSHRSRPGRVARIRNCHTPACPRAAHRDRRRPCLHRTGSGPHHRGPDVRRRPPRRDLLDRRRHPPGRASGHGGAAQVPPAVQRHGHHRRHDLPCHRPPRGGVGVPPDDLRGTERPADRADGHRDRRAPGGELRRLAPDGRRPVRRPLRHPGTGADRGGRWRGSGVPHRGRRPRACPPVVRARERHTVLSRGSARRPPPGAAERSAADPPGARAQRPVRPGLDLRPRPRRRRSARGRPAPRPRTGHGHPRAPGAAHRHRPSCPRAELLDRCGVRRHRRRPPGDRAVRGRP